MFFDLDNLPALLLALFVGFVFGRITGRASPKNRADQRAGRQRHIASLLAGLDPDLVKDLRRMIGARQSIAAVKKVREELGLGLRESKAVVDALRSTTAES
jgi:hypothetical protein